MGHTQFSARGKIGKQAPVSYPSIVLDAGVGYAMHSSGRVTADEERSCSRHEYEKGIHAGNDNVVDLCE